MQQKTDFQAPPAPAVERRADPVPSSPNGMATLAWGCLGFIVGAIFWHFIGFWSFVSDVVLRGHPTYARVVSQSGIDCTELALDRASGRVQNAPCPIHAAELAETRQAVRSDSERLIRLKKQEPSRWTVLINQDDDVETAAGKR